MIKHYISSLSFLRILIIPVLKFFNFKFKWKHDVTNRPFYLESFKHKGYWYYGKNREQNELDAFFSLIKKGNKVLEVGTHIGYFTQVFEEIVGEEGQVIAIEPTPESIFYLKKNISPKTKIICKAASDFSGEGIFYTTNFGGFTNSLDGDFTKSRNKEHKQFQHISSEVKSIKVGVDTVDNICKKNNFQPNFLKIDVEGAELKVLKGAQNTLTKVDALMVEICSNKKEIFKLIEGYRFKECYKDNQSMNYFFKKY